MPENTNIEDLNYNLSALHEKNVDMFRNITENSQIGIFMYHHNFLYANKALCEQSGYTLEELYGMNIWNLADESCRGKVKELILKRCCGELLEKLSHDFKLLTKNGEIKTVRIIVQTMQYNGKYVGVGTIIDISDIDKAKQKLVLLAQAIEHTDDMVKITDKSGTIIFVNDSVVKHSGYNRTEILGQTPRIFKSGQHDD